MAEILKGVCEICMSPAVACGHDTAGHPKDEKVFEDETLVGRPESEKIAQLLKEDGGVGKIKSKLERIFEKMQGKSFGSEGYETIKNPTLVSVVEDDGVLTLVVDCIEEERDEDDLHVTGEHPKSFTFIIDKNTGMVGSDDFNAEKMIRHITDVLGKSLTDSEGGQSLSPELTRERLAGMNSLEIGVKADFGPTLEAMRVATGADLQLRQDGYHLTVVGPMEKEILSTLDDAAIAELQRISKQIQNGEGVTVKGMGFIDGASSQYKMREVDKVKKTAFVALEIPALQEFRAKVGLPPKDLHLTLGFVGGDIHMHIVGQEQIKPNSPKMKDVTAPIPKQVDERFASVSLPDINYGGLDGPAKEKK